MRMGRRLPAICLSVFLLTVCACSKQTPSDNGRNEKANALYNSGNAYLSNGEFDKAIADYTAALEIMPDYIDALYNRGCAYYRKSYFDAATVDFTTAQRILPNCYEVFNNSGVVEYYYKGDIDSAIADWEAVLRINPNDANTKENMELARQYRGY